MEQVETNGVHVTGYIIYLEINDTYIQQLNRRCHYDNVMNVMKIILFDVSVICLDVLHFTLFHNYHCCCTHPQNICSYFHLLIFCKYKKLI